MLAQYIVITQTFKLGKKMEMVKVFRDGLAGAAVYSLLGGL
jgi:hypothetical protein